jgi:phage-related protein
MPKTRVVLFREVDGSVPILEWLEGIPEKVQDKCFVRIERLAELGHELRRPLADFLRDDIHELRARHLGVNYRLLYFFHGKEAVVLSHGFSKKQAKVPKRELELAIKRKRIFLQAPKMHSHEELL